MARKKAATSKALTLEQVEPLIHEIRGEKVIFDSDLARLHGVTTKRLNEQVKRNRERFPVDFVFQLTNVEIRALRSQIATGPSQADGPQGDAGNRPQFATGSQKHRDPRLRPYAFTEHGAIMVTKVLNTSSAVTDEYDVRGRRWIDCIGRLVRRPSDRERASQRLCRARLFENARLPRR